MKKLSTLLFALLLGVFAMAKKERSVLLITFNNGETVTLNTEQGLSMRQSYDNTGTFFLSVTAEDSTLTYQFADIKVMKFANKATDAPSPTMDAAGARQLAVSINGKVVTVTGAEATAVAVYAIDGTRQTAAVKGTDGKVSIDLSSCPAGHYVIKLNNNSIKVQIQ